MKNDVIIILPGFEYKPKGPLHIDKIKISVKVDGLTLLLYTINNSAEELEFLKVSDPSEFYDESDRSMYDGQEVLYSKTVLANPYKKVKPGYFCSFYTAKDTIYVSTINDPEYIYSLLNASEHDGLCYLKLNNINANIIFNVSFYSLVDYENNYVLFDTISYYYNPLITALSSISIEESTSIPMYYNSLDKDDETYTIELPDNVILFNKSKDKYQLIKYKNKEYITTDTFFRPENNMAWVCPLVFYKKNAKEVFLGYPVQDYLITTAKPLLDGEEFITPINVLSVIEHKNTLSELLKNIENQKLYFKELPNTLGLVYDDLHKHGIYLNNWGGDFSKEFEPKSSWGLVQSSNGYNPILYGKGPIKVAVRSTDYASLGLSHDFLLKKYPNNINADFFSNGMNRKFYRVDNLLTRVNSKDNNWYFKSIGLWSIIKLGIDSDGAYTWYKFYNSLYDLFDYLYNQIPYIKIENISPKKPFEIDYNLTREGLTAISVKNIPEDFIEDEKIVSLQDTKGEYLWWWLSSGIHRYIFPNYWLGVNYQESLLTIKNKSNYTIIPMLELITDNTNYGIYEDLIVVSNIDVAELLPSFNSLQNVSISNASFKINSRNTYNRSVLVDDSVTIHESGFYVFSYNGIKEGYSSYNTAINLEIDGKKIHSFKLPKSNNYIVLYLPQGKYIIRAEVENPSYMSMVHITDINLYKVNVNNTTPYGSILERSLESLKEESEYKIYTEGDTDVFPYVILPSVFTYAEVNRKCYKRTFNSIYPPPKAYQKVRALYTEKNNKAVEIDEKPSGIFLLGGSESIPSTISIEHITIKKLI